MKPVFEAGAMSRNQYLLQLNQVQETRVEVTALEEERSRVVGQIASRVNQIDRQMIRIRARVGWFERNDQLSHCPCTVNGKVFDVKVSPQIVVNADQAVLKIVPANRLQAKIAISDGDIGFVKVGLPVNVSVDSFPFWRVWIYPGHSS